MIKRVARTAYRKNLILDQAYSEQRKEDLLKYKEYVLENDPVMDLYFDHWPIDAYGRLYGKYLKYKRFRANFESRSTEIVSIQETRNCITSSWNIGAAMGPSKAMTSKRRVITFIGKPPHHRITTREPTPTISSMLIETQSNQTLHFPAQRLSHQHRHHHRHRSPGHLPRPRQRKQQGVIRRSDGGFSPTAHYPSACTLCGYLPPIPEEINLKLRHLFSDVTHLVPNLASIGLVHDRHLEILFAFTEQVRQEFFDSIPKTLFSPWDHAIITERLTNQTVAPTKRISAESLTSAGENPLRFEQAGASHQWPDDATRNSLMNSAYFLPTLKRTMGMKDGLFVRMIELARKHGKVFIEKYKPFEQVSSQRLSDAVDMVLKDEPQLRSYEDAWPIRFYLRWCAMRPEQQQMVDSAAQDSVQNLTAVPSTTSTGFDIERPSSLFRSGCPFHPTPDLSRVSSVIKNFFASNGMDELVVPLALNGITSEEQFSLFRLLDMEQIELLVARPDYSTKTSLNLFQRIMLKGLLCD